MTVTIDPAVLFPALAAIVTAIAASGATYLAVRRAKSGQINTTEADQLWKESSSIRRELRAQVQQLEAHIQSNEVEIAALRSENATLKHEVLTLRQENAALKIVVESQKQELNDLRAKTAVVAERQESQDREASQ